jgi:hypothetical protein
MNKDKNHKNHIKIPSEILSEFLKEDPTKSTKIKEIVERFQENGFILTLMFCSLPAIIPLPPGFTIIIGIPLVILSYQMILGYEKVHLPKKIMEVELKNTTIIAVAKRAVPILQFLESFLKPRLNFVNSILPYKVIAALIMIAAILSMNPLPFTHSIPAFAIIIMCLGLFKRDGLVLLLGVFTTCISLLIGALSITTLFFLIKTILKIL